MNGLPSLDNFDFVAGLYVYCMNWHNGQWSREYRILSRLQIRLTDNAIYSIQNGRYDRNDEWEQARIVYRELKRKYQQQAAA